MKNTGIIKFKSVDTFAPAKLRIWLISVKKMLETATISISNILELIMIFLFFLPCLSLKTFLNVSTFSKDSIIDIM